MNGLNMTICDVVKNSIWYDPRVRKQLIEYKKRINDLHAVGMIDERYDEIEVEKIDCCVHLAKVLRKIIVLLARFFGN